MKHYFEVTYPRRLAELKAALDPIAKKLCDSATKYSIEEGMRLLYDYVSIVNKFADNTRLHLTGLITDPKYLVRVTPSFILSSFGSDTDTGKVFASLYRDKLNNETSVTISSGQ